MAHDVFISYSMKDKAVADAVCATLEGRKIRCWIAPRDAQGGVFYAESIVDAISESRFMVLILSSNSNDSAHVTREVERAASGGSVVIPFRIEDVSLSKSLQYFIGPVHWLDALTPPLEKHVSDLANTIEMLLKRVELGPKPRPEPSPGPVPSPEPVPQPVPSPQPVPQPTPAPVPTPTPTPVPQPTPVPVPQPHPAPAPILQAMAVVLRKVFDLRSRTGRAVWFAGLGAAVGGAASLAVLFLQPTLDSPRALVAFVVSEGIIAGAVTWCWVYGSRRRPPGAAQFGTIGGLIMGGLLDWAATYMFAISSGDANLWVGASAVLWGAYGWVGGRDLERGEGARVGVNVIRRLAGVSVIRFLAIGLFRSEWVWVLWLHDAVQAIAWRFGLAASGSLQPAMSPSIPGEPARVHGGVA